MSFSPSSVSLLPGAMPAQADAFAGPPADSGRSPARRAVRELRLAAGFCSSRDKLQELQAALRMLPGIRATQILLFSPAEHDSPRLEHCLQRWKWQRPARPLSLREMASLPVRTGTLVGCIGGLAWAALTGAPASDCLAFAALSALLALAFMLAAQALGAIEPSPSRFDLTVRRRLAQGMHAVVVQDVRGSADGFRLIATMKRLGDAWCAEAPHRRPVAASTASSWPG